MGFCRPATVLIALFVVALPPLSAGAAGSVRLSYANDTLNRTDYYFTQGTRLEWTRKSRTFLVDHSGYTPTLLTQDEILTGDRPFASTLYVGHRWTTGTRFPGVFATHELDVGVIGPAAGGEWMQTAIHRGLGDPLPRGWGNQIRNDLILNYRHSLSATRTLHPRWVDAGATVDARLGTLYTDVGVGAHVRAGHVLSAVAATRVRAVGYNATLQGGVLNRNSPHTLARAEISNLVFEAEAGVALQFRRFGALFTQSWLSPELRRGRSHRWVKLSLEARY